MFNKEESNKKKRITIGKLDYQKVGKVIITSSLIMMLASPIKKEIICDNSEVLYLNRVYDYKMTRDYDEKIENYYNNYQIMIDGIVYPIEKFYILLDKDAINPQFHLINVKSELKDIITGSMEKYHYNKIVRLRDTTIFINLLNSDCVIIDNENKLIIIKDKEKAQEIINNWDGMIHDKVAETDAVENKDMLRRK